MIIGKKNDYIQYDINLDSEEFINKKLASIYYEKN